MLVLVFGLVGVSLQAFNNTKAKSAKGINFFIMEAFDHFKYRILMGVLPTFPILPLTKTFRWNW